tara:strand:- start:251 stop:472 length:222 start_codon:yes stop_codon:yes gene_type:complete
VLAKHGASNGFCTDQGCQFRSSGWIDILTGPKIKISMLFGDFANHPPVIPGKARYIDNRMIVRFWRSPKDASI